MKLINIFRILILNPLPKLLIGIQGLSSSVINYNDGLIKYSRKWEMDSLSDDMSSKPRWNYHSTLGVINNTLHPFSEYQNLNISSSPHRSLSFSNQETLQGNITKTFGYLKFPKFSNQTIEGNQSKRRKFIPRGIFKNNSRQPTNEIDKTNENAKRQKMFLEMNSLLLWYRLHDFMTGWNVRIEEFTDSKTASNDRATEDRISPELWYMILITICTIATIRFKLYSKLLKLKKSTWQTLKISRIIMEMVTNRKSRNWFKRIIFGFLLIASIVYVCYFYSNIQTIGHLVSTSVSRTFSPYIDRLNEIIPKVSKFNFVKYIHRFRKYLKSVNLSPNVITKDGLPVVLCCVLAVGYSLSIIAFLLEVIADKFMKSWKFRDVN